MRNKVCGPKGCLHESETGLTGRGMKNKVYGSEGDLHENELGSMGCGMRLKGPKDLCMKIKLGQRDMVCAQKNSITYPVRFPPKSFSSPSCLFSHNPQVCGPEGRVNGT